MLPLAILTIDNENDRRFITEIYLEYRHAMYYMIKKMIRTDQDVEDIINETVIRLIKFIATLRSLNSYSLRKYVMSTTKTTTINYLAKRNITLYNEVNPQDNVLDNMAAVEDYEVDRNMITLDEIQKLKEALKKLPQIEYDVLFMREYDGLTYSEIAYIMCKNENSVRAYASRAYRNAKALLAK